MISKWDNGPNMGQWSQNWDSGPKMEQWSVVHIWDNGPTSGPPSGTMVPQMGLWSLKWDRGIVDIKCILFNSSHTL